jgi:hypothetical protein
VTSYNGPKPFLAHELPLTSLIGRLLWKVKWLLLFCSVAAIAVAELGYDSTGGAALLYGILFIFSFDVARQPGIVIPQQWTFRPAILLPSLLVLVVGFGTIGLLQAVGASMFAALNGVNVMIALSYAVLGPWLVRIMAPERRLTRIGLWGRLWHHGLIAALSMIWLVLALVVIAYVIGDAHAAIALPVGIFLRAVGDTAIVAHAAVLVAAMIPEGE